ncbi:MAG TPA: TIGR03862 family flavoprotein [bacterium]|nr:TIGR03862 family flavoprotein [bacterium]
MRVAVIGAGPAGLMAAEVLAAGGAQVDVFDAMPTAGRKFLMAGKGGLNITHAEPFEIFVTRYGAARAWVEPLLLAFPPRQLREWMHGLGIESFVGSSGRVFPIEMKAAPLLRAWLQRLRQSGVRLHMRQRWLGWNEDGALRFTHPEGESTHQADAVVLALGGGSWARLGSDGAWLPVLQQQGVAVAALQPSNCGFECAWSEFLKSRYAGQPLKPVVVSHRDVHGVETRVQGELMLTEYGLEGGAIYALSSALRQDIAAQGEAWLALDLLPNHAQTAVEAVLQQGRGNRSLAEHLRRKLNLHGIKAALLRECLPAEALNDPARLAAGIKALPVRLLATRPMDEAISTAGGVMFAALDERLMLKNKPGVFCAGEMLDWDAPTGGYLLSACFASGYVAGQGVLGWLPRAGSSFTPDFMAEEREPYTQKERQ